MSGPIQPGFDVFETVPGDTYFEFPSEFPIPAGFFWAGSKPFHGVIKLEGVPIGKFQGHATGTGDTVVQRKQAVTVQPKESGATDIEMVVLSLRSQSPISVKGAGGTEKWDVKISVSQAAPSAGSMTITRNDDHSGVFSSTLRPMPRFEFRRAGSRSAPKVLDFGEMAEGIPPEIGAQLALSSFGAPWQDTPGPDAPDIGDLGNGFFLLCPLPFFERAALARHRVKCPTKKKKK